ncbi:MAG: dihydroorotate dehydrogenase (quinone) [Gammaproteobacteria bacterium RIFCSPHIGHO2_12_FULL_41_15]|nr:MAG: dihydroorotate dehydrogenase (quinone) [Gammaproteobacteria bacterium RIFCSPHIGHO2_12_FULL_41_15]
MIYRLFRPILFLFPPEFIHRVVLRILDYVYPYSRVQKIQATFPKKPQHVFNLDFPNPVGLAAGLDKNADHIDALFGLGFGFIEVGAVTPRPQQGNLKPRLFRLSKARALINKMGFNNLGVDYLIQQLKKRKVSGIVGVNIGKNADTALEQAADDYQICLQKVYPFADFVTINISSPNTLGLRELQNEAYLSQLLLQMKRAQNTLAGKFKKYVPLLVKLSPDLTDQEVDAIAALILQVKMDGIIAVNTSRDRSAVQGLAHAEQEGGLSGQPLLKKTIHVIARLHQATRAEIPLIAVGGIFSAEDVSALFAAGACLVQIYTGLIYQGPSLIRKIVNAL